MIARGQTFSDMRIVLDGCSFYGCTFRSCVFIYCASLPVVLQGSHFEGQLPVGVRPRRETEHRVPGDDIPGRCNKAGREHL
jgi:hypothetical protein